MDQLNTPCFLNDENIEKLYNTLTDDKYKTKSMLPILHIQVSRGFCKYCEEYVNDMIRYIRDFYSHEYRVFVSSASIKVPKGIDGIKTIIISSHNDCYNNQNK